MNTPATSHPQRVKVLIIDDTLDNLNILRAILENEGYSVMLAPSAEIGLKIAQQQNPDLILLDVMMPMMDGFETCRRLKADTQTALIPVIFVTARIEADRVVEGFAAGGVDYITKPLNLKEVLARVKTHLTLRRLEQ